MKPGEVYEWLDQGPAILLSQCSIPAPCREEDFVDFLRDPDSWPQDRGWTIKLLVTGEMMDVHEETLNTDASFQFKGVAIA
tara:strand:+ start:2999 stop:3241 length:243 start_codon:yes stop_codon:yes gene_type:complete